MVKDLANAKRPPKDINPFVNYIRRHERKFAQEIGKLQIMLREAHGLVNRTSQTLESLLPVSIDSTYISAEKLYNATSNMIADIEENEWIFDVDLSAAEVVRVHCFVLYA